MKKAILVLALVLLGSLAFAQAEYYSTPYSVYIAGKRVAGTYNRIWSPRDGHVLLLSWARPRGDESWETREPYVPSYSFWSTAGARLKLGFEIMQASGFDSGRALVLEASKEALYGYIGTSGSYVLPPRFAEAGGFMDGYAAVREPGKKWGVIDVSGALVGPARFDGLVNLGDGFFQVRNGDGHDRLYAAKKDKILFPWDYNPAYNYQNEGEARLYFVKAPQGEQGAEVYDLEGNLLIDLGTLRKSANQYSFKRAGQTLWLGVHDGNDGYDSTYTYYPFDLKARTLGQSRLKVSGQSLWYPDGSRKVTQRLGYNSSRGISYAFYYAADGSPLNERVFNRIGNVEGSVASVLFGNAWGDESKSDFYTTPEYGVMGLFDFSSKAFLLPPRLSEIDFLGLGLWYVRESADLAYVFDQSTRKKTATLPALRLLWYREGVLCGSENDYFAEQLRKSPPLDLVAVLNDDKVRLRSGPSTSGAIVTSMNRGDALRVHEIGPYQAIGGSEGFWLGVDLLGSEGDGIRGKGWVFSRFVDILGPYEE